MSAAEHHRRIDVLAIGLFGLAVGALTLGVAQVGGIPESNKIGTLVIALIFGGVVQILAGITDIRYHEQLGGTALTMYGFFWLTVCTAKLVSASTSFHLDMILYVPINLVYAAFSAVMVYLTAYRNATLCILHIVITLTFSFTVLARLDAISELIPGFLHIVVGLMAFYHAIASLTQAFTGVQLVPLGPAFLHRGDSAFIGSGASTGVPSPAALMLAGADGGEAKAGRPTQTTPA
jgi:uncharacterized protein